MSNVRKKLSEDQHTNEAITKIKNEHIIDFYMNKSRKRFNQIEKAYSTLIISVFAFLGAGFFTTESLFAKTIMAVLICFVLLSYIMYVAFLVNDGEQSILKASALPDVSYKTKLKFWSIKIRSNFWWITSVCLLFFALFSTIILSLIL